MPRKINYFIGVYGSGKTTAVENLNQIYDVIPVYEDEDLIWFLKQTNVLNMELSYLNVIFYKIKQAITISEFPKRDILVDGHPLLALVYGRAFFETEHGQSISFPEWGILNKIHTKLYAYANRSKLFDKFEQTIYYINLPFRENWENITSRDRRGMNELDEYFLENLRRILHQEIYGLAEYYHCNLIEIKSKEELSKLTL